MKCPANPRKEAFRHVPHKPPNTFQKIDTTQKHTLLLTQACYIPTHITTFSYLHRHVIFTHKHTHIYANMCVHTNMRTDTHKKSLRKEYSAYTCTRVNTHVYAYSSQQISRHAHTRTHKHAPQRVYNSGRDAYPLTFSAAQ